MIRGFDETPRRSRRRMSGLACQNAERITDLSHNLCIRKMSRAVTGVVSRALRRRGARYAYQSFVISIVDHVVDVAPIDESFSCVEIVLLACQRRFADAPDVMSQRNTRVGNNKTTAGSHVDVNWTERRAAV